VISSERQLLLDREISELESKDEIELNYLTNHDRFYIKCSVQEKYKGVYRCITDGSDTSKMKIRRRNTSSNLDIPILLQFDEYSFNRKNLKKLKKRQLEELVNSIQLEQLSTTREGLINYLLENKSHFLSYRLEWITAYSTV
jgi:DNA polymerase elongation subunit (family B)